MLSGLNRRFLDNSDGYAEIIMIKLEKIKEYIRREYRGYRHRNV
jgi:hypothetical protein